jgi:hypothetical protein
MTAAATKTKRQRPVQAPMPLFAKGAHADPGPATPEDLPRAPPPGNGSTATEPSRCDAPSSSALPVQPSRCLSPTPPGGGEAALTSSDGDRLPANDVGIYELDRGFKTVAWLCDRCVAKRKADGWGVKDGAAKNAMVPPFCDDCDRAKQEARRA